MAFIAEVRAKLGLDTEEFRRKLTQATANVGEAAGDMNRKLKRAFGAGDVFKGMLQGLGIGTVQSVVDKIVGGFAAAAEEAKTIAEMAAETLGIYQRIFASRRTDEQNLAVNLKEQARLQKELEGTRGRTEMRRMYGPGGAYTARFDVPANVKRAKEIDLELAKLSEEENKLKDKIKKKTEETSKEEGKKAEELQKAREQLATTEQANLAKQQTTEEQIATLEERRSDIRATIALSGDEDLSLAQQVAKIDGEILDLEKQRREEAKRIAEQRERETKALAEAQDRLSKVERSADRAFEDRSAVTLADVAGGKYGTTQTQKARAKEIQRLENQSRRQRAMGFEAEAFESTSRALKLRAGMYQLGDSERDPMLEAKSAIIESEQHLAEIRASLKVVQPGGGNTK